MALFKKGDAWYIDYYVDGKRRREAIGPNRKMAEKALAKRRVQVAENEFLDIVRKPKTTFDELAKIYIDYAKTNKLSWTRDEYSIKRLSQNFAGKRLEQISPFLIEKYKNARVKEVSVATLNRELACLKHMFSKAIEWKLYTSNPVKSVKLFKEHNQRLRYLTVGEVHRLIGELPVHLKPVVQCALHTGMRRGEILGLKWDDIDLKQRLIFVRNSKNGEGREIPVAVELLRELRPLRKTGEYVFSFDGHSRIQSIRTGFENATKRAGISDFTFHDLRHTFASHLVMSGVDLLTVKELLGHKSINMTLRYSHLSPDHKRNAVDLLKFSDGHYLDTKPRVTKQPKTLSYSTAMT